MPQPLSPPYGTSTAQPRTLNRWLDVNSQNGPLGRTRGFINLPLNNIGEIVGPVAGIIVTNNFGSGADFQLLDQLGVTLETVHINGGGGTGFFTLNVNAVYIQYNVLIDPFTIPSAGWIGFVSYDDHSWSSTERVPYNEKLLQFNYQATRNFSLVNDSNYKALVAAFNGIACVTIANVINNGSRPITKRYKLTTQGKDELGAEQYNGQKILGKYFQIEFWSLLDVNTIIEPLPSSVIFNTSLLGNVDYRYGIDFNIHNSQQTKVIDFQNTNPDTIDIFNLPLTFNANNISGIN